MNINIILISLLLITCYLLFNYYEKFNIYYNSSQRNVYKYHPLFEEDTNEKYGLFY